MKPGLTEALLVLAGNESVIVAVLDYLDKMENGSEETKGDFLGADLLPSLDLTSELMEQ